MNYYDGNKIFILNLKRKRKDKNVQGSGCVTSRENDTNIQFLKWIVWDYQHIFRKCNLAFYIKFHFDIKVNLSCFK